MALGTTIINEADLEGLEPDVISNSQPFSCGAKADYAGCEGSNSNTDFQGLLGDI